MINIPESTIQFRHVQASTVMHSLNSGHLAISIMEFGPEGWQFPEACRAVRQERDFRTSTQHVATPQRFGPTSMRSQAPLSLFGHAGFASASGRAAASRGNLSSTKAGRESRPSRSQSLAHRVGQALLCLAVGPLSNGHFGLDVCSGSQFGNKPGVIIGNPFPDCLGRYDKGQLLHVLPGEELGEAREGEGCADKAAEECLHAAQFLKGGGNGAAANAFAGSCHRGRQRQSPGTNEAVAPASAKSKAKPAPESETAGANRIAGQRGRVRLAGDGAGQHGQGPGSPAHGGGVQEAAACA